MTIFHHLPPARPTAYSTKNPPFNAELLDRLMEEANLDVLLITSKHNVQYFLGGYSFIFFSYKEAIGLSRYLPIVVYVRGRPDETAYFGNALEAFGHDEGVFWPQVVSTRHWGTTDAIGAAAGYVTRTVGDRVRIGTERAFLPLDAADALRHELPRADFAEAYFVLEELRRIKSPAELDLLRLGSEAVVEAMQTVCDFLAHGMGLVAHEAPRLTDSGPVPYPADGPDRPLEPGVVISVETAIRHPVRGYIKLEDTVAVTSTGCVGFGDDARGWNRPGQAA
jgi:Xaa-Pro aminopeptidase